MKKTIDFLRENPRFDFLLVLCMVQVALVIGKLLGMIAWRWLWVLTPIWGLALVCVIIVMLCVILASNYDYDNYGYDLENREAGGS